MAAKKGAALVAQQEKASGQVVSLVEQASSLEIGTDLQFTKAQQLLLALKDAETQVENAFGPQKEASHTAYKVALDKYNEFMKPVKQSRKLLANEMSDWEIEQERLAEVEQQRLNEEAEKAETKEKAKLEEKAEKLREEGLHEEAEEAEQEAEEVYIATPVVIPQTKMKAVGVTSANDWEVTVMDPMKLIKALASGKLKLDLDKLLTIKVGVIKSYVKATGITTIPGCNVKAKKVMSARKV